MSDMADAIRVPKRRWFVIGGTHAAQLCNEVGRSQTREGLLLELEGESGDRFVVNRHDCSSVWFLPGENVRRKGDDAIWRVEEANGEAIRISRPFIPWRIEIAGDLELVTA